MTDAHILAEQPNKKQQQNHEEQEEQQQDIQKWEEDEEGEDSRAALKEIHSLSRIVKLQYSVDAPSCRRTLQEGPSISHGETRKSQA